MYVDMRVCMYGYIYVCTYMYIYIYIYVCVCVCVRVYEYISCLKAIPVKLSTSHR